MFNWFHKKEIKKDLPLVAVNFSVNNDGKAEVDIKWLTLNSELASTLGRLLFLVQNGGFTNDIVKLLNNYAQTTPVARPFLEEVIAQWAELTRSDEAREDDPCVQPDEFFTSGNTNKDEED
jgi:hypothetical protein